MKFLIKKLLAGILIAGALFFGTCHRTAVQDRIPEKESTSKEIVDTAWDDVPSKKRNFVESKDFKMETTTKDDTTTVSLSQVDATKPVIFKTITFAVSGDQRIDVDEAGFRLVKVDDAGNVSHTRPCMDPVHTKECDWIQTSGDRTTFLTYSTRDFQNPEENQYYTFDVLKVTTTKGNEIAYSVDGHFKKRQTTDIAVAKVEETPAPVLTASSQVQTASAQLQETQPTPVVPRKQKEVAKAKINTTVPKVDFTLPKGVNIDKVREAGASLAELTKALNLQAGQSITFDDVMPEKGDGYWHIASRLQNTGVAPAVQLALLPGLNGLEYPLLNRQVKYAKVITSETAAVDATKALEAQVAAIQAEKNKAETNQKEAETAQKETEEQLNKLFTELGSPNSVYDAINTINEMKVAALHVEELPVDPAIVPEATDKTIADLQEMNRYLFYMVSGGAVLLVATLFLGIMFIRKQYKKLARVEGEMKSMLDIYTPKTEGDAKDVKTEKYPEALRKVIDDFDKRVKGHEAEKIEELRKRLGAPEGARYEEVKFYTGGKKDTVVCKLFTDGTYFWGHCPVCYTHEWKRCRYSTCQDHVGHHDSAPESKPSDGGSRFMGLLDREHPTSVLPPTLS